jgi:phosphatidylglycerol---prolipoprotein diacylglyceryl transferase
MSLLALPFPAIDPVAFSLGPISVRWYGLSYVVGIMIGIALATRLAARGSSRPSPQDIDAFSLWAILAIIVGGRLGSVLFYNFGAYWADPLQILMVWKGGMSFHGGMLGVILAFYLYARRNGFHMLALGDIVACATPPALMLGRFANFINGELWGRPSDAPWAMVFPLAGDGIPRHPSQLYQAGLEGPALFIVLWLLARSPAICARTGILSGVFLIGYALARIIGEFFREPDAQIGYLAFGVTMGQLLSVPMALVGVWIVASAPFGKGVVAERTDGSDRS